LDAHDLNLPEKSELASVSSKGELSILLGDATPLGRVMARLPLSGGAPREALEHVLSADWSPDGESLAIIRVMEGSERRIEYPSGKVLYEAAGKTPAFLRVSPDGELVAFVEQAPLLWFLKVITRSGAVRLIVPLSDFGQPVWSADGRELWFTQST